MSDSLEAQKPVLAEHKVWGSRLVLERVLLSGDCRLEPTAVLVALYQRASHPCPRSELVSGLNPWEPAVRAAGFAVLVVHWEVLGSNLTVVGCLQASARNLTLGRQDPSAAAVTAAPATLVEQ